MDKERIGRRAFLGVAATAVAGSIIGGELFVVDSFYPFRGLLSIPEAGTITPEDFKDLIICRSKPINLEMSGGKSPKIVSLNKEAFAQAIYDVSKHMLPKDGPERVYSVLTNTFLGVSLYGFTPEPKIINGEKVATFGNYNWIGAGGPVINYYKILLEEYLRGQLTGDVALQNKSDQRILHEIAHLIQEIRNPLFFPNTPPSLVTTVVHEVLISGKPRDRRNDPDEIEARKIANEIAESRMKKYLAGSDPTALPFGKFFTFS